MFKIQRNTKTSNLFK